MLQVEFYSHILHFKQVISMFSHGAKLLPASLSVLFMLSSELE